MSKLGEYEVHPAAAIFPLLEGAEFDELVQDIKQNGLKDLITLNHAGTVLIDGRNRYRACEVADTDPVFYNLPKHKTELQILQHVVSANMARRHLNPGQRATVALELEPMFAAVIAEEEAERKRKDIEAQRNKSTPDLEKSKSDKGRSEPPTSAPPTKKAGRNERSAAGKAAKATGASRSSTANAKYVQKNAPDLYAEVRAGHMSLDAAYKRARQRVRSTPKPEPAPKPNSVQLVLRTHTGDEVYYPKPKSKATFNESKGDGISWAAWSWNPVTGCLHGCPYCYARAIAHDEQYKAAYPVEFTPLFHEERLNAPSNTTIPGKYRDESHAACESEGCKICAYRRVFVCSMADLYGRWVPDEWIQRVHASMLSIPQWQYILLTKFPSRYVGLELPPNAWVGTSVDEQKRVRIAEDAFRNLESVNVKWLSLEPLREPLEFTDLSMFDWVVIGAQTETRQPDGAVPAFRPPWQWVVRITQQAADAGCKIHWKPNLRTAPGMVWPDEYPAVNIEIPGRLL